MNLNRIKRLEDEANFCMKNPRSCSIRTFDILEDARGRITELETENEKLLRTMKLHAGDCRSLNNEVDLFRSHWEDAEEEIEKLRKALQDIADVDTRHFHSAGCHKIKRIVNKTLKG